MESDTQIEVTEKKTRKRNKRLCAQIRKQMEFYFSDANLSKDRYLRQLVEEDSEGYVNLKTFSKFNRIRSLTYDMELVAKALSKSELLEVSHDKKMVKRKKAFEVPKSEDVDKRTVYVECLPAEAKIDWVRDQFTSYGEVLYVSLPKYLTTGDHKGFAFVEFDSIQAAEKACMFMNHPPVDAPDKPGRFPKFNKQLVVLKRTISLHKPESHERRSSTDSTGRRKRKYTTSESSVEDGEDTGDWKRRRPASEHGKVPSDNDQDGNDKDSVKVYPGREKGKRKLRESKSGVDTEAGSSKDERDSKIKRQRDKCDSGSDQEQEGIGKRKLDSDDEDYLPSHLYKKYKEDTGKKKGEKRKQDHEEGTAGQELENRPPCIKRVRISDAVEVKEALTYGKKKKRPRKKKLKTIEIPELRVIPKVEWLRLRQEYLTLQKSSMAEMKRSLKQVSQQQRRDKGETGDQQRDAKDTKAVKEAKPRPEMEFTPGVIVKISSGECMNRKQIKERVSKNAQIAYIDVKEDGYEGYIRCQDSENAKKIVQSSGDGAYTYLLLEGDEEMAYWKKLREDREHKLNSKKRNKKRGFQKILDRADRLATEHLLEKKHVFFGD